MSYTMLSCFDCDTPFGPLLHLPCLQAVQASCQAMHTLQELFLSSLMQQQQVSSLMQQQQMQQQPGGLGQGQEQWEVQAAWQAGAAGAHKALVASTSAPRPPRSPGVLPPSPQLAGGGGGGVGLLPTPEQHPCQLTAAAAVAASLGLELAAAATSLGLEPESLRGWPGRQSPAQPLPHHQMVLPVPDLLLQQGGQPGDVAMEEAASVPHASISRAGGWEGGQDTATPDAPHLGDGHLMIHTTTTGTGKDTGTAGDNRGGTLRKRKQAVEEPGEGGGEAVCGAGKRRGEPALRTE